MPHGKHWDGVKSIRGDINRNCCVSSSDSLGFIAVSIFQYRRGVLWSREFRARARKGDKLAPEGIKLGGFLICVRAA